ncbi:MAG: D-sedoheptulose 7-phosphate isomerase [Gemmatimonadota bacterium]|nr:MAG: D-sedoheptulose 7-phosphate isomerase [Gemmatimonadota bacterium]
MRNHMNYRASIELIQTRLAESAATKTAMRRDDELTATLASVAATIVEAYRTGNKLLLFGNGGSAADAQHIAAELVGRFYERRRPLAAVALNANTCSVTSVANDFSFGEVFEREIQALGQPGDVAIGISTSGSSANVVRALDAAKAQGLVTVAFTGVSGGGLKGSVDHCLRVPSDDIARVQEGHITAGHIICELVENALFG